MTLFVFGLSHKTADLALREKIAVAGEQLGAVLEELLPASKAAELALLSTCNRTEFHCVSEHADESRTLLQKWCEDRLGGPSDEIASVFYSAHDLAAVRHLIRVGSGLDSMVLGEPQIFGQMKTAYAQAVESNTVQQELHRVYNHVFSASKRVRSDTGIGANPVSVVSAAVRLSHRVFTSLDATRALLVGAGDTISLAARHLRSENVAELTIANRTLSKGLSLAEEVQAKAIELASIPEALKEADIVMTSTASQLPIIGKGMVEQAIKARKNKPIFIVDIAVPRDVEEQVGELDNVYLYTIDDLRGIVEDNKREREAQVVKADEIIADFVQQYAGSQAERSGAHRVRALRDSMGRVRDQELDKALVSLRAGRAPEEVLQQLANTLTNKFVHAPSVAIKQASAADDEPKLRWAEQMLNFTSAEASNGSADDALEDELQPSAQGSSDPSAQRSPQPSPQLSPGSSENDA